MNMIRVEAISKYYGDDGIVEHLEIEMFVESAEDVGGAVRSHLGIVGEVFCRLGDIPVASEPEGVHGRFASLRDRSLRATQSELANQLPVVRRCLRRDGDFWTLDFDGRSAILKHGKGVADLAMLLRSPSREIHCLDLMGSSVAQTDLGPTLDTQARRAYEERIRELQEELDEADRFGDIGRGDRAQQELDVLVDQLVSATGLSGRDRKSGGDAERARSAVTQRIRGTLRRLDEVHPHASAHLRRAIHTGTFCSYEPTDELRWVVESQSGVAEGSTDRLIQI